MSVWKKYRRTNLAEMRPYIMGESLSGVSVSEPDKAAMVLMLRNNIDPGGMVARNPQNHADQWYVAKPYFDANFEPLEDS